MTHLRTRALRHVPAALLVLTACGPQEAAPSSLDVAADDPVTISAPASPSESASSETAPEPEPQLIPYAGGESRGFEVQDRADAQDMTAAPADFRRFIGRTAQAIADNSSCTDGYVGVTVMMLRTDGYASGGVNDCGGYMALWAVVDGEWKEIAGSQEMWDCAVLEQYAVPSDVAGTACYDYDAQEERSYEQS